jgi:Ala-tRNA(Pro) deacylase
MSELTVIQNFLDDKNVKYATIIHSPAFTAQEIAASCFISGKEFAKTLILNVDGDMVMAVLPASRRLHLPSIRKHFQNDNVFLASESEFHNIFTRCKTGAMPPFGNLYGLNTYVAREFEKNKLIAFNAGSHREIIRMKFKTYKALVNPEIIVLSIA